MLNYKYDLIGKTDQIVQYFKNTNNTLKLTKA